MSDDDALTIDHFLHRDFGPGSGQLSDKLRGAILSTMERAAQQAERAWKRQAERRENLERFGWVPPLVDATDWWPPMSLGLPSVLDRDVPTTRAELRTWLSSTRLARRVADACLTVSERTHALANWLDEGTSGPRYLEWLDEVAPFTEQEYERASGLLGVALHDAEPGETVDVRLDLAPPTSNRREPWTGRRL